MLVLALGLLATRYRAGLAKGGRQVSTAHQVLDATMAGGSLRSTVAAGVRAPVCM
jgi:hypothetical protein